MGNLISFYIYVEPSVIHKKEKKTKTFVMKVVIKTGTVKTAQKSFFGEF